MKKDNVSVIIRTRNEEQFIGFCLQSVLDCLVKPEIIIIDNNSTDETVDIVKSFRQDPTLDISPISYTNIIIDNMNEYTPGKALNRGVKLAKNKYILIISAHCVLQTFNLKCLQTLTDKHCGIWGNQYPVWRGRRMNKRYMWANFNDTKSIINYKSEFEDRYFFHNALAFFTKASLKKYPLDEYLRGKEDRYWARKIVKAGKSYVYEPTMFVCEHHFTKNGATFLGVG